MNRSSFYSRSATGFTLIEVVVAIGIFTVIIFAVGLCEANIFSYSRSASNSFTTVQDAQVILKTLSRDIRIASPGSDGSYALQTVATNTLMFFADVNGDGVKERVRYSFIGKKLYRTLLVPTGSPLSYSGTESTSTILTSVVNDSATPVFKYFDGTYTGTTTGQLSQPVSQNTVRLIQINLMLDASTNLSSTTRTYTTVVTLRNLKDNL